MCIRMYGCQLVWLSWILNWSQVTLWKPENWSRDQCKSWFFDCLYQVLQLSANLNRFYVIHDCVKFSVRLIFLLSRWAENTELVWYPSFMSTYHLENPISEYIHLPTLFKCLDTKRDWWSLQNLLTLTDFELENLDLGFIGFSFYHEWDSKQYWHLDVRIGCNDQ